jgi:hypothetical protein
MSEDDTKPTCSFCGKTQDEVRKLIAGPKVYICDECIDLCNDIIMDETTVDGTFRWRVLVAARCWRLSIRTTWRALTAWARPRHKPASSN